MSFSKAKLFNEELQLVAEYHKSLAHPARLAILEYLAQSKTCISGDISEHLPLARTTINQHLTELKKMGIIKGEICGAKVNYCINVDTIKIIQQQFSNFTDKILVEKNHN